MAAPLIFLGLRILPYIITRGGSVLRMGYRVLGDQRIKSIAQRAFGKDKFISKSADLSKLAGKGEQVKVLDSKMIANLVKNNKINPAELTANANAIARGTSNYINKSPWRTTKNIPIKNPIESFFNVKIAPNITGTSKFIIAEGSTGRALVTKELVKAGKIKKSSVENIGITKGKPFTPTTQSKVKDVAVVKEVTERPWYVAMVPHFLRTSKETLKKDVYPFERVTTEGLTRGGKFVLGAEATGVGAGVMAALPPYDKKAVASKRITDPAAMFETGEGTGEIGGEYEQLTTGSAISLADTDAQGNFID